MYTHDFVCRHAANNKAGWVCMNKMNFIFKDLSVFCIETY